MSLPHVIRLRGPWRYEDPTLGMAGDMTVPGRPPGQVGIPHGGRVLLSRRFQWLANLPDEEQVYLEFTHLAGQAQVVLNGELIATYPGDWNALRVDVTGKLRRSNDLQVELSVPSHAGSNGRPFLLGIMGDVRLVVSSRQYHIVHPWVHTSWIARHGVLTVGGFPTGDPAGLRVRLSLDGQMIEERNCPPLGDPITISGLTVEPWMPRHLGTPCLYDFELDVLSGETVLFTWRRAIGFRKICFDGRNWSCNDRKIEGEEIVISTPRGIEPHLGEDASLPFEQWKIARAKLLRIEGHLAAESVLRLCDRAGLLVEQEVLPLPENGAAEGPRDRASKTLIHTEAMQECVARGSSPSLVGWRQSEHGAADLAAFLKQHHQPIIYRQAPRGSRLSAETTAPGPPH